MNTAPINNRLNNGYGAILLVQGTGSLDMDVNYQVSLDGDNWYTPRVTDGTGLTSVTAIVVAATQSEWIIISPRVAPWVRFQLDPDATGNWSAYYVHQEDAS